MKLGFSSEKFYAIMNMYCRRDMTVREFRPFRASIPRQKEMEQILAMLSVKQTAIQQYLTSKGLNAPQQDAITTINGPVSVLAGAGSGKTTAIVNRIAFMMQFGDAFYGESAPLSAEEEAELKAYADGSKQPDANRLAELTAVNPVRGWNILAITFTNKAAAELKARLEGMLGEERAAEVWAATFHSACVRILRQHIDRLGYDTAFTIYDKDDSQRVIKACLEDPAVSDPISGAGISEKAFPPKTLVNEISRAKDRLMTPEDMLAEAEGDFRRTKIATVYAVYQERLKASNALDFDDIIALTVKLFRACPDVLEKYQNRCKYLLVDEYQDTNRAQYELIRLLSEGHGNLCVVGDDDQSIYKFRGATIENILSFEEQFPNCKVICLEQNYRSTKNILGAANSVIAHNENRKAKTLWTAGEDGDKIYWYKAQDQNDEASFIVDTVLDGVKSGGKYGDYAVLYRTHALSNSLERHLAQANVPYRIYGGLRFYDRKEVKDIVAYLCVIHNNNDLLRFSRIINEPKRSIGPQTLADIMGIAGDLKISPIEVLRTAGDYPVLQRKAASMRSIAKMFDQLTALSEELPLDQFYDVVLEKTGYAEMLKAMGEEGEARLENVMELKTSIMNYLETTEEPSLNGFLEEISLYTDQDRADESQDAVTLMTIHAAKGLEYENVFLLGMEDGIFPNARCSDSQESLEEERRLAYVAITRAKKRLYVLSTNHRMLHGQTSRNFTSRFLKEIEPSYVEKHDSTVIPHSEMPDQPMTAVHSITLQQQLAQAKQREKTVENLDFSAGDRVRHSVFGEGTVLSAESMAGDCLLEIAFEKVGTKKVLAKFARIRKIQ